jgi:malate dehydrogenase (oxaloacetate-decarboxylating)
LFQSLLSTMTCKGLEPSLSPLFSLPFKSQNLLYVPALFSLTSTGRNWSRCLLTFSSLPQLNESTFLIYGAGSAGLGIARQIRTALTTTLIDSDQPLSTKDANARFVLVDQDGLLTSDQDDLREGLREFAREDWKDGDKKDLRAIVERYKPSVMIGTSTHAGAFSEEVVREMAKHTSRPIIFPLSNPTKLAECQPQDAMDWTDGKALLATGSPFDDVEKPDGTNVCVGECNNALVYPGLMHGAILAKATSVTPKMIVRPPSQLPLFLVLSCLPSQH